MKSALTKYFVSVLSLMFVCGCGAEAVGTAATGASIKQQELEEGQRTMERMESSIEQMNLQSADRMRDLEDD